MTIGQNQQVEEIVRRVLERFGVCPEEGPRPSPAAEPHMGPEAEQRGQQEIETEIPDIRAVDYRQVYRVPNPAKPDEFTRLKARTWARLGQGRSGPRYTTATQLRFWADQAAAMDAVFTDVSPGWLEQAGRFTVQTRCGSKDEYLTNPELGAQFDEAAIAEIKRRCMPSPKVQVFIADGLSSTSVEANVAELLPALEQGLKLHGLGMGTPFFVRYGRVRSMEPVSEALDATVTCVLLGERPGLASAESLSAYLAYRARVGMSEADRTCVSNIHSSGSNPIEAGAHLADLISEMVRQKTSGIHLKL